jgi:hypothetical protein
VDAGANTGTNFPFFQGAGLATIPRHFFVSGQIWAQRATEANAKARSCEDARRKKKAELGIEEHFENAVVALAQNDSEKESYFPTRE